MESFNDLFNQQIMDDLDDSKQRMSKMNLNEKVHILHVPIESIVEHPDNHKIYLKLEDEIFFENLKQDILENGIIHIPVCIKKGSDFVLVDGHRRIAAIRALYAEGYTQFEAVDIKVVSFENNTDELEFMLAANVKVRKHSDYSKMMQISAYSKIYDQRRQNQQLSKGLTKSCYIAKHMQMGERQINKYLYIRNKFSDEAIKQLLEQPEVTINSFYASLKAKSDEYDYQFENKPGVRLAPQSKKHKQFDLNKKERQLMERFTSSLDKVIELNEDVISIIQNDTMISKRLKRLNKNIIATIQLLSELHQSSDD